jgi:sterol desaturase/sphingolipid hydroxylase (fatty acid hydroxylase superfamily)
VGHLGFESITFRGKPIASDYFHYLHHKYVNCNFGMDMMPWDKWLGVYFDGMGEFRPKGRIGKKEFVKRSGPS